jgi:hypothetical protein
LQRKRHAEVEELDRALAAMASGEKDVGGLEVAVHDAGAVRDGERVEELREDVEGFRRAMGPRARRASSVSPIRRCMTTKASFSSSRVLRKTRFLGGSGNAVQCALPSKHAWISNTWPTSQTTKNGGGSARVLA